MNRQQFEEMLTKSIRNDKIRKFAQRLLKSWLSDDDREMLRNKYGAGKDAPGKEGTPASNHPLETIGRESKTNGSTWDDHPDSHPRGSYMYEGQKFHVRSHEIPDQTPEHGVYTDKGKYVGGLQFDGSGGGGGGGFHPDHINDPQKYNAMSNQDEFDDEEEAHGDGHPDTADGSYIEQTHKHMDGHEEQIKKLLGPGGVMRHK